MELIDLQCNSELKAKFREELEWKSRHAWTISERTTLILSEMFKRTMYLFGSTYLICDKLFSTMNFNKSKTMSRLIDAHLQDIMKVSNATSLRANVSRLSEKKHSQVSGSKH